MRTEILNSYIATVKNIVSGAVNSGLLNAPVYAYTLYNDLDVRHTPALIDEIAQHCKVNYCAMELFEQIRSLYLGDGDCQESRFEQITDRLVVLFNTFDKLLAKVERKALHVGSVSFADLCELFITACRSTNSLASRKEFNLSQVQYGRAQAISCVLRMMGHEAEMSTHAFKGVYTVESFVIDGVRTQLF